MTKMLNFYEACIIFLALTTIALLFVVSSETSVLVTSKGLSALFGFLTYRMWTVWKAKGYMDNIIKTEE